MKTFWDGEESLIQAFWILGFGYGFIIFLLNASTKYINSPLFDLGVTLVGILIFVFYNVSVWRCAKNTSWEGWFLAARILVVTRSLFLLLKFFSGLSGNYSVIAYILFFDIGTDLFVGIVFLTVFAVKKFSGQDFISPDTREGVQPQQSSELEVAKQHYLAKEYKEALRHFELAEAKDGLDALSKRYKEMCQRRLVKPT